MKQKEIIINGKLSIDAEQLIEEYFAVKRVNKIEGFIVSDEDFINRHKGTYPYYEFSQADYHAVYRIKKCDICFKPFSVNINDREHLYNYLQAPYKLCSGCKIFHHGLGQVIGMKLDGDIAS